MCAQACASNSVCYLVVRVLLRGTYGARHGLDGLDLVGAAGSLRKQLLTKRVLFIQAALGAQGMKQISWS